jgi:dolichol-phosphate mannosyltransferase
VTQSDAVRAYLDGSASAPDAADAASLPVSAFLDLIDRIRADQAAGLGRAPAAPPADAVDLSVVIPVHDEEENIDALLARLVPVVASIGTYEIIFVDDLSSDRSRELILAARAGDPGIKLVELTRNFGHQGALAAGLDHASGRAVVLMDGDLQDPPELLSELVARWQEGYEVVYAVREKRKEGVVRRACFYVFYRLLARIAEVKMPLDSGDFCLMDRQVVDAIRDLPESARFLRGLRGWVGYRQIGVTYERPARHAGESKYSMLALVRLALDGLVSFSDVPLRLASLGGFLTTVAAFCYLMVAVVARVFGGEVPSGWTSIILVQLLLGGAQLTLMGIIGEYLGRTYHEAKRRPSYVVRTVHGTRPLERVTHG